MIKKKKRLPEKGMCWSVKVSRGGRLPEKGALVL